MVHRAVSHGEVLRLRPGLFCLAPVYRHTHPHPFAVASMLHFSSHISMESALSHHGLIPESVSVVTSVTTGRSRRFSNPLGEFTYTRVPAKHARAGVEAVDVSAGMTAFVAGPLRAIADLIYVRPRVSWRLDGIDFLTDSMRIDEDDIEALDWNSLPEILASLSSERVKNYLAGLHKEMGSDR